jgi:alkanesulfonate monooxygenase SsuD/methylene tetrahydromethanopterin reductase-like flavin-dependent oxidoreductase (luciferase family)
MLDQCVLLEDLGYDSAWFSEHHSGPYSFGNPALMIATAATRTKRLKLGTGVSLLPLHHPIVLSEEYAMLDRLTGGRLEYGIGRGYLVHEYPWLNVALDESVARYREAVDFIVKAWTCDTPMMSFEGKHVKVDRYKPFPGVVQKPYPRIYSSAVSPESFAYAGSKNLDVGISVFSSDITVLPKSVAEYEKALSDGGFSRANREVMGITQMYCAKDQSDALAEGKRYAENYYKFFAKIMIDASGPNPAAEYMQAVNALDLNDRNQTLFGNPDSLIEKITRMRDDLHLDYLQLEVAQGGCPPKKVVEVLRLFGEKVIPHFKTPAAQKARREAVSA